MRQINTENLPRMRQLINLTLLRMRKIDSRKLGNNEQYHEYIVMILTG